MLILSFLTFDPERTQGDWVGWNGNRPYSTIRVARISIYGRVNQTGSGEAGGARRSIEAARVHHAARRRGAAWPFAARAQQPAMPVIGFLSTFPAPTDAPRGRGFRQGLKETGFVEGENVTIEYRLAEKRFRSPSRACERLGAPTRRCDRDPAATRRLRQRRRPRRSRSSSRSAKTRSGWACRQPGAARRQPDGNQFFSRRDVVAKRLALLRELVPKAVRVALLGSTRTARRLRARRGLTRRLRRWPWGCELQILRPASTPAGDRRGVRGDCTQSGPMRCSSAPSSILLPVAVCIIVHLASRHAHAGELRQPFFRLPMPAA